MKCSMIMTDTTKTLSSLLSLIQGFLPKIRRFKQSFRKSFLLCLEMSMLLQTFEHHHHSSLAISLAHMEADYDYVTTIYVGSTITDATTTAISATIDRSEDSRSPLCLSSKEL